MSEPLAPVDPNVRIPAAVLRHAASAEIAQKAYLAAINPDQPQPDPEQKPDPDPQPEPPLQPEPPQPEPEKKPEPEQKPAAAADDNDESWKRKFESAQGRINDLNRRLKNGDERMEHLERLVSTMQAAPPPAPVAPTPPPSLVTEDDLSTFGPEFFQAVERKAQELLVPLKADFEAQLTQLGSRVSGVAQTVQKDAKQIMTDKLDHDVPNWLVLNEDEEFIGWLNEYDPLTGVKRQVMLLNAWENNDGSRVANFFKLFLREQEAVKATDDTPPAGARPSAPTVSLGAFAAPGKAKTAANPKDEPARQPITRKYIAEFYADVNAGKYRGNPQRKEQIERDIFAATAEGRIT